MSANNRKPQASPKPDMAARVAAQYASIKAMLLRTGVGERAISTAATIHRVPVALVRQIAEGME